MKEAGCRLLIVGFESGDPQILKNIKKGATVERAREFAKDCHDLGLVIHADFILGLPGETKESIRNTINFAKTLDCETIQVSIAHAYPGTEFYDFAKATASSPTNAWKTAAATRWRTSSILACPSTTSWRWCTASTTNTTSAPRPPSASFGKQSLTAMCPAFTWKPRRS